MRVFVSLSFAALLSSAAFGQSEAPRTFDIADVHSSPRATWVKSPANAMQGGYLSGDRYEVHRATMVDLIHTAYGVDSDKVYGGPSWLDYDKFEVIAKAPPGTRPEVLRQMLQSLLADRFKLAVKPDTQALPAYILTVKDRTKLKSSDSPGSEGCQSVPLTAAGPPPQASIRCRGVTMDEFVSGLRRLANQFFDNLPLVNSTALEGAWDIDLKYTQRGFRIDQSGTTTVMNATSIFDSLDKQVGLKLELGKAPQQVLTVESVNQQPTPNSPGVEAALPPRPAPEFDVASIRTCDTTERIGTPRVEPGGRVTATCMPLLALMNQAFSLNAQDRPAGLPKSLDANAPATRLSIVAKAPAGAFPNNDTEASQTRDALNAMIRALLIDRYKITTHTEDRPMDALTLVAVKPKMTKADPSGRTGCTRQGDISTTSTKVICRNITMAQFAEQILALYPQARYPVLDNTHLDGAWDFTLEFNPRLALVQDLAQLRARAAAESGAPQPAADASEPASGPANVAEAMEKQIGLKLETHKRPEPVLVFDHMEEKPTEN